MIRLRPPSKVAAIAERPGRTLWVPEHMLAMGTMVAAYCNCCGEFMMPVPRVGTQVQIDYHSQHHHWHLNPACTGSGFTVPFPLEN